MGAKKSKCCPLTLVSGIRLKMIIAFGLKQDYRYKLSHEVPAQFFSAPDVLGYEDYQHIPDVFWHCLNCGSHVKDIINGAECLYEFKRKRPYLIVR